MKALSKDEAAQKLAETHYSIEEGMVQIFRLLAEADAEARPAEPIKLLEVNADTVSAGVLPLYFAPLPDSGLPYPCVIVEVTPDEFRRIQSQELKLPHDWLIGEALPRPVAPAEIE